MVLDNPAVSITPESLGLHVVRPYSDVLAPIEIDFFQGQLPPGAKSVFFVHATEDRHLREVHPISRAVLEQDQKTRAMRGRLHIESYRASWVKSKEYATVVEALTEVAQTAVVNAHVVTSKYSQKTSYGIYPALLYFPESFTDRAHIPDIKKLIPRLAQSVRSLGQPGDDWFYGLGALTGIRTYTNHFAKQRTLPLTNGNVFTGCMVAKGIQRLVTAWAERRHSYPSVGIVGASGSTGMITVANVADWYHGHLTLAAIQPKPLDTIATQLPKANLRLSIAFGETAAETVARTCDIVVYLVSDPSLTVNPLAYRPNAIVYDPSRPRVHQSETLADRPDVWLLDGPSVRIPGSVLRPGLNNYDSNEMLSCMAQTAYHAVSGEREFLMPPLRANDFDYETIRHESICFLARTQLHGFHITEPERRYARKISREEIFER